MDCMQKQSFCTPIFVAEVFRPPFLSYGRLKPSATTVGQVENLSLRF
jgi:hypothetical protein